MVRQWVLLLELQPRVAAKVGGGTGDGFTTPDEGVGPPPPLLLLLVIKTTATATTVPNPTQQCHGPNHMLAEYRCLRIGASATTTSSSSQGSVTAASSQGFGVSVDRDSFGKWSD